MMHLCRDYGRLTVQKYSSPLTGEESMGHVGGVVSVGITNGVDTRNVGDQTRTAISLESSTVQRNTSLLSNIRALLIRETRQERSALNGLALSELNAEKIKLRDRRKAGISVVGVTVLETLDLCDGSVVDCNVVQLQVLPPLGKILVCEGLCGAVVGSVDKGVHVGVEGCHLSDEAGDLVERGDETEGLIGVLVAVAPGTPEDALAPVLSNTGRVREKVLDASCENDLAGCDCLGVLTGVVNGEGEGSVVALLGLDVYDCGILHLDSVVVGE